MAYKLFINSYKFALKIIGYFIIIYNFNAYYE
jgi:hypothetical protein